MKSIQKSARLHSVVKNSGITEDLWPEILKRLPVESLCRFRSVGKSWNSLISSSFFIDLHYSFSRSSITASSTQAYNTGYDVHFPFQFRCDDDEDLCTISIVDVIRGLVCISYTLDSCYDSTILWNPAIHKYLTLPRLPFPSHIDSVVSMPGDKIVEESARFYSSAIGFGYDGSRDDLKVVRIWMCKRYVRSCCGFIPTTYEVYSTRQGLWRMATADHLKSAMFDIPRSRTGCFFNGSIHWLVTTYDQSMDSVLMFDCEREEFTTVDFPQQIHDPDNVTWVNTPQSHVSIRHNPKAEVLEYGGMLSVLMHRNGEDGIELWAMKEHGLPTTWHKLFTLGKEGCDVLNLYRPSFLKLAPHGPNQWIKLHKHVDEFRQVYAYEESMFFMNDSKAKSYTDKDTVDILIPTHYLLLPY